MELEKTSQFKNSMGMRYTKGLFFETTLEDKSSVVYTLKENDHKGYKSLKRLYLEEEDPSEYIFASKWLDSYDHWKLLTECTWFKPIVAEWREELRLKLESKYLKKLMEIAEAGGKEGISANKILLERVRKPKERVKKDLGSHPTGHPWKTSRNASNGEIDHFSEKQVEQDYLRLVKSAV